MGILERVATKNRVSLANQSLVGRSHTCVVRIDDPRVSAVHATIAWSAENQRWEARDLGSRNGTSVDGRKLTGHDRVPLREGSELRLANEELWILKSALPPVACAISPDGSITAAENGLLALPDAGAPLACVYEDADGFWWVDTEARLATDQETIDAGGLWVLSIPPVPQSSIATTVRLGRTLMLELLTLRFRHTIDEEHVELALVNDGDELPPIVRAYNYSLLVLARARLRDHNAGMPDAEQGWLYVEKLLAMLKMDAEKLNVDIHRARRELADLGVIDAGAIVERRVSSRQVRIGTNRIEIIKI